MVDPGGLRLAFAYSAGAATFFAPCAFPLLPGYVAYYLGADDGPTGGPLARLGRAAVVGGLASLGFFLVYAGLAGVALALGTRTLRDIAVVEPVVGGLLVVLGAAMALGRLQVHVALPERRRSGSAFLLFGVVYAVAAAGCTAPLFVGIAAVALSGGPVAAVATLGAYAAGMATLMLAVTGLAALGKVGVVRALAGGTRRVTRAAGGLLVLAGLAQIYLYAVGFDALAPFR